MSNRKFVKLAAVTALAIALAACGGGSGGGLNSTPTPTPTPTPEPTVNSVELLDAPATQEFATYSTGATLRIRYDAATSKYEVMAPGQDWDALIDNPGASSPGALLFASSANSNEGYFSAEMEFGHSDQPIRYHHSSFAYWQKADPGTGDLVGGTMVFGAATLAGGVPVTGSATYEGFIKGWANVPATSGWGDLPTAPITGTVSLNFDFGGGELTGQIDPGLACDCDYIEFPTLNFSNTVFGVGSQTFSGRFDTNVDGVNSFSGLFTGPNAQELIGQWTFPFMFNDSPRSATGIWIAKRD